MKGSIPVLLVCRKCSLTQCVVMFIVTYDIDGVIVHHTVPPRLMVNSAYYCTFLQHCPGENKDTWWQRTPSFFMTIQGITLLLLSWTLVLLAIKDSGTSLFSPDICQSISFHSLVEHRASVRTFQRTRFVAMAFTSLHTFPHFSISSFIVLLHVPLGRPTFRAPCGFHSSACFSIAFIFCFKHAKFFPSNLT